MSIRGRERPLSRRAEQKYGKQSACCGVGQIFLRSTAIRIILVTLAATALLYSSFGGSSTLVHPSNPLKCVAFIQTAGSSITGVPIAELPCDADITKPGGYCVCEAGVAVYAPRRKWYASPQNCTSRCFSADLDKSLQIPDSTTCPTGVAPFQWQTPLASAHYIPSPSYDLVSEFWDRVMRFSERSNRTVVLPPGPRTHDDDFVAKGLHLNASQVGIARKELAAFAVAAGPLPVHAFSGRGIAILSGDAPFLVPSIVAVKTIRRTGCTLPIELWFPSDEVVTGPLVTKLQLLGAHVCAFPTPLALGKGFYMKAAVVALSSFEAVLLLDADQVVLQDVTQLFYDPAFVRTGALLWPDLWHASWSREAARIIDVRRKHMPRNSFESGQMLFNKTRTWPAIVSALHFNLNNELYFPLFSNYLGQGDKETFAMALMAHRLPFHLIQKRARSLGYTQRKCNAVWCWNEFVTNTMAQHDTQGQIMFLHTNMKPKWSLTMTTDPSRYLRRWQVLNPGVQQQFEPWEKLGELLTGHDVEMFVHKQIVALRCDEHVKAVSDAYSRRAELHRAAGDAPAIETSKLLPYLPMGIDLLNTYERNCIAGPFLKDQPPSVLQVVRHWISCLTFGKGTSPTASRPETQI